MGGGGEGGGKVGPGTGLSMSSVVLYLKGRGFATPVTEYLTIHGSHR